MIPPFRAPPGTELVRPLGGGATFEVALVRRFRRELVAKRPAAHLDAATGLRALERERAVLSSARLDALPRAVRFARDRRGPYLCETAASGMSLRALASLGTFSWSVVARAASRGLAELHEAADERGPLDIVHGDISPDNVFAGGAYVTFVDFANACFRDAPEPVFPDARGTTPYAAPEIARGEASATAETDTYALAAVLAWLLVGPMTEADGGGAMLAEVGDRGLRVERLAGRRDVPAAAVRALAEALAFAPGDRLVSSRELFQQIAWAW